MGYRAFIWRVGGLRFGVFLEFLNPDLKLRIRVYPGGITTPHTLGRPNNWTRDMGE